MSERLSADELAVLKHRISRFEYRHDSSNSILQMGEVRKLLSAADEAQRLRAAIQRHRENRLQRRGTLCSEDAELWEALK